MVYAEFGGQTECIMGNWKIENWSEMRSRVRIWTTRQHTPLRIPWNMPRIAQSIIDSVHFLNQKSGWVHPYICPIGTGLK